MNIRKPLIIVDDDIDDQDMIVLALKEIGISNHVMVFRDAESAINYLYGDEQPFLIISDINMPKMDGFHFKAHIDNCDILKEKRIPFVFLSTSSSDHHVKKAHDMCAQGYFEKGTSFVQLKDSLLTILKYWQKTKHLN